MKSRAFNHSLLLPLVVFAFTATGCSSSDHPPAGDNREEAALAPTNRIDIPAPVRRNLGITFARVERRAVGQTIRVPGRFEWLPTARREYRTPLEGRIELLVEQFQEVHPDTALYRLDSPQWRDMQREIESAKATLHITQARLVSLSAVVEAHELHEQGLREAVELWTQRVAQLEEVVAAGGGRAAELAQARIALNEARSAFGEVLEKHAELGLRDAELKSEQHTTTSRLDLLLRSASSVLGVDREVVDIPSVNGGDVPLWKATHQIEVRANAPGVVELLPVTQGTWVDRGALVLSVVDPRAVRFRAVGLQSDLYRLQTGLDATIVQHRMEGNAMQDRISSRIELGLLADPDQRTIDLIAMPSTLTEWSRAGVSAFLEVMLAQSSQTELAIPLSCVVRDGLKPVIFRRDPSDPNKVIRIDADLGVSDGRWVVIESGVREGDEIVLDGVYPLMLATSGTTQRGGHFHADGTFHADDH